MGKPKAPAPTDPTKLANAQAEANRVTTFGPFGNVAFGSVGKDGSFVPTQNGTQAAVQIQPTDLQASTIGLQQQTENDIAQQLQSRVANLPQGAIDVSDLPQLRTDFADQGAELERASFDRAMGLLNPVFDQRQQELESNLAVRGLPVGSEAANDSLSLFAQQRNNAELSAAQDAVAAGRAEQSRLFGLNQAARGQGFSEQSFLRNQPFNELAAALSGTQLTPFQSQPVNAAGVDVLGANALNFQQQNSAFQAAQQQQSDVLGGLFGLGSAALPLLLSDRRLKRNISQIGKLANGLKVYRYRFKGLSKWFTGLMADEVKALKPHAVHRRGLVDVVDYREAVTC